MQRALLEVALLSVAAGLLGTWIVLRGLAFFAHAAGTAAFPGLVLADGLGFGAPLGAFATALLFAGGVSRLAGGAPVQTPGARRGGYDSVTALVLVGCLALGVILASDVFHSGSGLQGLLFGSDLLVDGGDLVRAAAASRPAPAATWWRRPRPRAGGRPVGGGRLRVELQRTPERPPGRRGHDHAARRFRPRGGRRSRERPPDPPAEDRPARLRAAARRRTRHGRCEGGVHQRRPAGPLDGQGGFRIRRARGLGRRRRRRAGEGAGRVLGARGVAVSRALVARP